MSAKYIIELVDKLTRPARAMRDALGGVQASLGGVASAAPRSLAEILSTGSAMDRVRGVAARMGSGVAGAWSGARGPLGRVVTDMAALERQVKDDRTAVAELRTALRAAQGAFGRTSEQAQVLQSRLKVAQGTLAASAGRFARLGGATSTMKDKLGDLRDAIAPTVRGFAIMSAVALGAGLALYGAARSGARLILSTDQLDGLSKSFKSNVKGLFSGVDSAGFAAALGRIVSLFDQNTATGKLLKSVITAAFDGIAKAIPWVIVGLQQMIIWALRAYIFVRQAFKSEVVKSLVIAIGIVVAALAIYKGVLIAITVVQAIMAMTNPFVLIVVGVGLLIAAIVYLWRNWDQVWSAIKASAAAVGEWFVGLGRSIIDGIVNGITGAAGWVWDAIRNVAQGAVNAFKSVFGIASPSKVMAQMGRYTGQGFTAGLLAEGPRASGALASLAMPPGGLTASAVASSTGRAAVTQNAGGITVVINAAVGDVAAIRDAAVAGVADALERWQLQAGA